MIGKNGESTFIKVCMPLDESETALCSEKDEACGPKADYVEKEKIKNEGYITQIKNGLSNNGQTLENQKVKLRSGENIIANDGGKKVILDSTTFNIK